jgi:signal transduction histidine kinase
VRRALVTTWLFALAVVLVVALASLFTYTRVRAGLEDEFARRVEWVAAAGAAEVQPHQVRLLSALGPGAFATSDSLLLALGGVRRSSQAARVLLLDPRGTILLDSAGDSLVGHGAALTLREQAARDAALRGLPSHGDLRVSAGRRALVGFAPVRDTGAGAKGPVIAVLAVESSAEFLAVLPGIARLLASVALFASLAVLLLAALFVRRAASQAALEASLARAENLASVGELAATLAHEVRNPLGVIQGAAQRLSRHYEGPEAELFDYIQLEVDRLAKSVRRYLDFARPSAPGEGGDLGEALSATLGLLEREVEGKQVALVREGLAAEAPGAAGAPAGAAPAPSRVRLGGEELKQVLFNLVRNALEALPEGGTIRVGWAARAGSYELWVADDGPGMSAELARRVRRPFVTTRAQGTGLGLAIVDRLVREAGGRFELETAPGKGTTCRLRLPGVSRGA